MIVPCALLVISRSVSIFCVTITFMPINNWIVSGSLFLFCRFPCPRPLAATAYHSTIVNSRSCIISSTLQMNNCWYDYLQCFLMAERFHSILTVWHGVMRLASLHPLLVKSVGRHSELVVGRVRSINKSSSFTAPLRRH